MFYPHNYLISFQWSTQDSGTENKLLCGKTGHCYLDVYGIHKIILPKAALEIILQTIWHFRHCLSQSKRQANLFLLSPVLIVVKTVDAQ